MLKKRKPFQLLGAAAVLAIWSTAHSSGETEAKSPTFSHPRLISNPYLPLSSLKQDILESKNARIERTAKPEIKKMFKIGSQNVESLAIEDREYENGGTEYKFYAPGIGCVKEVESGGQYVLKSHVANAGH